MTLPPAAKDDAQPVAATRGESRGRTSLSKGRNLARRCAVQALYQWQITQQNVRDIDAQFVTEHDIKKVDVPYFQELLHQVPAHVTELDAHYATFLDRPVRELDPVECAILRMSVYELAHRPDIPYRVVINEGVDMAKVFGAEQSHKYINGVLDKVARRLRAAEMHMRAAKPAKQRHPGSA